MKVLLRSIFPPGARLMLRKLVGDVTRYSGPYSSWNEAMATATGYSDDAIAKRVRDAARKVASGKAAYEQDSVLFYSPSPPERILRILTLASRNANRPLAVLDFGGSLGSLYFRAKPFLAVDAVSTWTVCEQPGFVRIGREFEDGVLRFAEDPGNADKIDVLVLSSVLPYLENPIRTIEALTRHCPDWILIDRTPLSPDAGWHLFNQHVPASIYRAIYPAWLIPWNDIRDALHGYSLVEQSETVDEVFSCDCVLAPYRWMIWRNRTSVSG